MWSIDIGFLAVIVAWFIFIIVVWNSKNKKFARIGWLIIAFWSIGLVIYATCFNKMDYHYSSSKLFGFIVSEIIILGLCVWNYRKVKNTTKDSK